MDYIDKALQQKKKEQTAIKAVLKARDKGYKNVEVNVLHDHWCSQLMGTGDCDCYPDYNIIRHLNDDAE